MDLSVPTQGQGAGTWAKRKGTSYTARSARKAKRKVYLLKKIRPYITRAIANQMYKILPIREYRPGHTLR